MAGDPRIATVEHSTKSEVRALREELNKVVTDLEKLRAASQAGGVVLVNEIRDDISAGSPNYRAIITELQADHGTTVTAVDEGKTLADELHDDAATNKTAVDALVDKLNFLLTEFQKDRVTRGEAVGTGATLAIDANANDIQMGNAIEVIHKGLSYYLSAEDPIDLSTKTLNTDTISAGKWGVAWVFQNTAGVADAETPLTAQTVFASLIECLAEGWTNATNTLPPGVDDVVIGHVALLESVGGGFVWGPDSISAETSEEFKSYVGLPGVESEMASFALEAGNATFVYGALNARLGDQTRIAMTGKINVALPAKTNVADTKFGAWIVYGLADDVEYVLQVGAAFSTQVAADDAIRDANPNPYLPVIGTFTLANTSGADFIPGTTLLDASGIAMTFNKVGSGSSFRELGRGQVNQAIAALTDEHAATLTAAKATAGPPGLTASSTPAALGAAADASAVDAAADMTAATINA